MLKEWAKGDERVEDEMNDRSPMGRMVMPEEIAQAALFLAADECSSAVNGAALVVDGGCTITARGHALVLE